MLTLFVLLALVFATSNANANQSNDSYTIELGAKTRVVQAGDTYQSIASSEYGSAAFWRLIAEHNELNPVTALEAGQVLQLPMFVKRELEFASVAFFKGDVMIIKEGESPRKLVKDDRFFLNDAIKTGKSGFVSLSFRSGSVISVQPKSRVELVSLRCLPDDDVCVLGLNATSGEISSNVNRYRDQPTDFRIITPYASAAVRGTVFDFQASRDGMLVGVTEGSVAVAAAETESAVATGFGVVTKTGQTPGGLVELIGPPTFRGVPARFATGDKISWWDVPKSERYIVSLASDAGANEVVSQSRQDQQVYKLDEVSAGEYFINVRPVDGNGLKGFGTTQKINVVEIDQDAVIHPLDASRDGEDVVISVAEPSETIPGYEFQISTDATFDDVISIDVGSSGSAIFRPPQAGSNSYFARARALLQTDTVSRFGPAVRIN